jgi:hypothetical protein
MRQERPVRHVFHFNPAARAAVKSFRDSKPWRGTVGERANKFAELHRGLCRAYDLETMLLHDDAGDPGRVGSSGGSAYDRQTNKIVLRGRLSVVTYLFCFGAAVGMTPGEALSWSRDVFAHFFPRSFRGCRDVGGMLVRD